MDVKKLLVLYRNNQCTEEEARWLIQHIRSGNDRELLEEFIDANLIDPSNDKISAETELILEEAFKNIIQKRDEKPARRSVLAMWPLRAAAAIFLLLSAIGIAIYLQKRQLPETNLAIARQQNFIPNGLHESVLILGDGRIVTLGKTVSGEISGTGRAKIHKTDANQLQYLPQAAHAGSSETNVLAVSRGDTYQLLLSDGSKVWLNAGSRLEYPSAFTGSERHVKLVGEAYFEVAKNPEKPFRVMTSDMEIKVLGTSFNVNAYPDEPALKTTLVEGSVKLTGRGKAITISPGEQVEYTSDGELSAKKVNPEDFLGWKQDVFHFTGTDFDVIMRQIARWYDVKLVYKNGKIPDIKIGGEMPRSSSLEDVIKVLKGSGVNITLHQNSLLIDF